jgi:transcription elongation factor GreA
MKSELADLKRRRIEVTEDIRRAAADKDFRENAPLHAAREQKGHIEGRIKELEEVLKDAVVLGDRKDSQRVGIGDTILVADVKAGREISYMIVHPKEVDASKGRISSESPIGKAIIGKKAGETFEVSAPAGKLKYTLLKLTNKR